MRLHVFGILLLIYGCRTISSQTNSNELTGLWKLVTVEKKDASGRWQEDSWMKNGTGYIMYDGRGHMAVQMAPEGYKNFSWLSERDNTNPGLVKSKIDSFSMEELKLVISKFSSHQAYFANYKILGDSVIVHDRISNSNPSAWNSNVQRTFAIRRDTLILQLPDGFRRLTWIKQK